MTSQVLVIDNYDSFTFNLVQYLRELGAEVTVERNDTITVADVVRSDPAAIVISPGPKTPEEAGICVELVRVVGGRVPILGVCLGHQAIGVAYGATVVRAPHVVHGKVGSVHHRGDGVPPWPGQSFSRNAIPLARHLPGRATGRARGDCLE